MMQLHFDVYMMQDDNVTIAQVDLPEMVDSQGRVVTTRPVTGSARRHPTDEPSSYVGAGYALSRLFAAIGELYAESTAQLQEGPTPPPVRDLYAEMFGTTTHKEENT